MNRSKQKTSDQLANDDIKVQTQAQSAGSHNFFSWNLFHETNEISLALNPSGVMQAWRERALRFVVVASLIVNMPVTIAAVQGNFRVIPQWAAYVIVSLYLPILLACFIERINFFWRISLILGIKAIIGAVQLITTQLIGSGRLTLIILPVTALILGGTRIARNTLFVCLAIIGLITYLITCNIIIPLPVNMIITNRYWFFQGFVWLGVVLPHLYLIGHFLALHEKTLAAVCAARNKIDAEAVKIRQLEFEINRIGEEERRKLGAELHDGLCQHLTATLLNCSALEYQLKATAARELPSVEQIRCAVEKSIGMAYEVARGLCPVHIESDALIPALQQLCRDVRQQNSISCKLHADLKILIQNPEHGLHLYRIASESVKNAIKHSGCSKIIIKLARNEKDIVLEIADDGKAITNDFEAAKGMGLNIMAYRASLMGGILERTKSEAGGTCIICRLPIVEHEK